MLQNYLIQIILSTQTKLANGIHLNIGDTVSINSAYISERGAGASVIEFKGKDIGKNTHNHIYECF